MDTTTVKGKAEATAKDPVEARMTASLTQIRTYNKGLTKPETPDPLFSFYMELQKAFPKITRRDITDMLSSNIIFTQETPTEKRTEKFEKFLGAFPDMSEDLKAQGRAALASTISGVEREIPTAPAPRPEIVTEAVT